MEFKVWTRKSNAIAAVTKEVTKLADEGKIDQVLITAIDAEDIGIGNNKAFAVRVYIDNGQTEANALQAMLGNKAEVKAEGANEEAPAEAEKDLDDLGHFGLGDSEESAKCPHCGINHIQNGYGEHDPDDPDAYECEERIHACLGCGGEWGPKIAKRSFKGRNSPNKGHRISIVGGKQASNPYREGTKSHAAFQFLQNHPDTLFEDLQGLGVRVRTVTEMLRNGTARRK